MRFCRFSPDGRLFASTSCDRTVRLWDAADAKCLQVLKGKWAGGRLGAKQPGLGSLSDLAVSCATSTLLDTWRVSTGHQRSVETVSFSHDSKQLASGGWDKRVMLWEVQVCGGAASEAWDPEALHTGHPFPIGKGGSIFTTVHVHTWCSTPLHLAAATSPDALPTTLVPPLPLSPPSSVKALEAPPTPIRHDTTQAGLHRV